MTEETKDEAAEREEAKKKEEEAEEEADRIMEEVEENPPEKLEDWPGGKAKYRTIGGDDANEAWEDGPTAKLGPADLKHHEDGSVSIEGEKVDNPEDYKGEPIPGGPTDPETPNEPGVEGEGPDSEAETDKDDD